MFCLLVPLLPCNLLISIYRRNTDRHSYVLNWFRLLLLVSGDLVTVGEMEFALIWCGIDMIWIDHEFTSAYIFVTNYFCCHCNFGFFKIAIFLNEFFLSNERSMLYSCVSFISSWFDFMWTRVGVVGFNWSRFLWCWFFHLLLVWGYFFSFIFFTLSTLVFMICNSLRHK